MEIHHNKPKRDKKGMQAPTPRIRCYMCQQGMASLPDGLGGYMCEECYNIVFQAVLKTRSGEVIRHSLVAVIENNLDERHYND